MKMARQRKKAKESTERAEETGELSQTYVSMQSLKQFAQEKLPDSALKEILMSEGDEISAQEFIAKLPIYLKLLKRVEEG